MPDTVFDEDTLAAASEVMGEEEERPLTFAELGVPGPLVRVLAADDKKTAFPIQADTLPDSLAGRDILGRGRTGSGKTLAFSIPLPTPNIRIRMQKKRAASCQPLFPNADAIEPKAEAKPSVSAGASVAPVKAPMAYFRIQPMTTV